MATTTVCLIYAPADAAYAERLTATLRTASVTILGEPASATPGSGATQESARQAIETATAVIYIGSPEAARSSDVRAQVIIAAEGKRRIIPLWAQGDQWSLSAPFELMGANYLDARGAAYPAALDRLRQALGVAGGEAVAAPPVNVPQRAPDNAPRLVEYRWLSTYADTQCLAWSPDGSLLAAGCKDGAISIHSVHPDGDTWFNLGYLVPNAVSVAWSPDGSRIAAALNGKSIKLFPSERALVCVWAAVKKSFNLPLHNFPGGSYVAWSTDGSYLAYDKGGTCQICDPDTGIVLKALPTSGYTRGASWAPDSARLAVRTSAGVSVWDHAAGRVTLTIPGDFSCIAWSPDGARLATGAAGGTVGSPSSERLTAIITIWDALSGNSLRKLISYNNDVARVAWSPDGSLLASCGFGDIRLWDPASERNLVTVRGDWRNVAWQPNGPLLAASSGNKIRVWHVSDS